MIEEILPNLYKIEVPLPRNPLRAINCYTIKDGHKSLIIDTGMNREECMNVLSSGLKELGVELNKADFFLTHMHADHAGLVSSLATDTSKIYSSQADADIINDVTSPDTVYWDDESEFARRNGFPENELQKAIDNHPGYKYGPKGPLDFYIVKEGDTISIGNYLFRCIETPGHSPGHLCLYESSKKILFSGDHILSDITPNIQLFTGVLNTLNDYLESLDKVYELDVDFVLPGHRKTFRNHKERIQELKHHHEIRIDEILSILKEGDKNAFKVASQMSWDIKYEDWGMFPVSQKWFAAGEALSHLKYLEDKEKVKRKIQGQEVMFSLK